VVQELESYYLLFLAFLDLPEYEVELIDLALPLYTRPWYISSEIIYCLSNPAISSRFLSVITIPVGFEGEFTTTVKDGKIGGENLKIDTVGGYATYRSPGLFYLKGRAGYVAWDAAQTLGESDKDSSGSYGLGLGISLKVVKFELEYTRIDDQIDFISLGILF